MNKLLTIVASVFIVCSFNSCKQCTECNKYPGKPITLCKKDFGSDESYAAAFRQTVADGYKCD